MNGRLLLGNDRKAEWQQKTAAPVAYRPKQAAQALGIGLATLYRRIKAGDIATTKFGGATLISHAELQRVSTGTVDVVGFDWRAS